MREKFMLEQRYETQPTANTGGAMLDKLNGALHDFVDVETATAGDDELTCFFTYQGYDHKLTVGIDGKQEVGFILDVSIESRGEIDRDVTHEAFLRVESAIGVHFDHARMD